MCENCKNILGSCVRPHTIKCCPLMKSSYCTMCSSYGHTYIKCRLKSSDVEFLEQLIPPSILQTNEILTNTPILRGSCTKEYVKKNVPEFIEELIPEYLRKQYSICSETPIVSNKNLVHEPPPFKAVLDVVDHPKAIRDLLKAYGDMPKKQDRSKDKYKNHLNNKSDLRKAYNIEYHTL